MNEKSLIIQTYIKCPVKKLIKGNTYPNGAYSKLSLLELAHCLVMWSLQNIGFWSCSDILARQLHKRISQHQRHKKRAS